MTSFNCDPIDFMIMMRLNVVNDLKLILSDVAQLVGAKI